MSYTRREFLTSMIGASSFLSLAPTFPAFLPRAAAAAAEQDGADGRALVVLQLSGGNDGLNSVVPYADDAYGRNRHTLRLTAPQVLRIDDYLGLHPELKDFHRLLSDGQLTVVQGVGYPHNNRDHDAAMREWHTGRPGEPLCPTGWIGRAADVLVAQAPAELPAVFVGPIAAPFALNAQTAILPAIRTPQQLTRTTSWGPRDASAPDDATVATQLAHADHPLARFAADASRAAQVLAGRVETVLAAGSETTADYPHYTLAQQLRMVAQLLRAEVGIRVYFVELGGGGIGGFDNHANQRDNHAALLREMSASMAAFVRELQRDNLLSRVLLMTFSEFGRTVTENGRRGTDHGAAAPVFLAGGGVQGGLFGPHPSLTDLDQDALKFSVDYRSLYATLLHRWLGLDPVAILGQNYAMIDVIA
jgi:uncharacterized protein (DUF1501 family)